MQFLQLHWQEAISASLHHLSPFTCWKAPTAPNSTSSQSSSSLSWQLLSLRCANVSAAPQPTSCRLREPKPQHTPTHFVLLDGSHFQFQRHRINYARRVRQRDQLHHSDAPEIPDWSRLQTPANRNHRRSTWATAETNLNNQITENYAD